MSSVFCVHFYKFIRMCACNIHVLRLTKQCKMKSKWLISLLLMTVLPCALVNSSPSQQQTVVVEKFNNHSSEMCLHPWTLQYKKNTTEGCECGVSLGGVVRCDPVSFKLEVLYCYCVTYSEILGTTVVGYCLSTCHGTHTATTIYAHNVSDLDRASCGSLHKTGQMCGGCEEGYAPPVYSYSLACVECSNYKYNWLKYIAVAFLPLTGFYIFVVVFRINVFSGNLNALILTYQFLTISALLRYTQQTLVDMPTAAVVIMQCFMTLYSLWNLDFFRTVYTPFCLHPKLTAVQTLALDYTIALYPLLLIVLTYLFVTLHDRYSILIRLCSPFCKCLSHFHNKWRIHRSLADVFATFILLSYVKVLDISFNLLTPTRLWNENGTEIKETFLYFDGTVKYFRGAHIPYAILAIGMLCVFNIFPLLLLAVYPSRRFQRCLNCCHCQCHVLRMFMDTFQGYFKTEPHDYRYFAAFYLLLRFVNLTTLAWTKSPLYFPLCGLLMGFGSLVVALIRPWKCWWHNVLDSILLGSLSASGTLFYAVGVSSRAIDPAHSFGGILRGVSASLSIVPGVCGIVMLACYLTTNCRHRVKAILGKGCLTGRESDQELSENTPLVS